jgi:hypothetical protein
MMKGYKTNRTHFRAGSRGWENAMQAKPAMSPITTNISAPEVFAPAAESVTKSDSGIEHHPSHRLEDWFLIFFDAAVPFAVTESGTASKKLMQFNRA